MISFKEFRTGLKENEIEITDESFRELKQFFRDNGFTSWTFENNVLVIGFQDAEAAKLALESSKKNNNNIFNYGKASVVGSNINIKLNKKALEILGEEGEENREGKEQK